MKCLRVLSMTHAVLIDELKTLVDAGKVLTDADSLNTYGKDWTKHFAPAPTAIVFPKTIEQVQAIVRWANRHRVALVPSGGRTGRGGVIRLHEPDSRHQPHRPYRRVPAGRGHRAVAAPRRRTGPVLSGGLRFGGLQPDWRQYRHQCRRDQGDSLRHDPQLGGRPQGRHRQGRRAGAEQGPDQERHRL